MNITSDNLAGVYDMLVTFTGNQTSGNLTTNSNIITNIITTNINIGDVVIGENIPNPCFVTAKTSNTITISQSINITKNNNLLYTHKNNIFEGFQNNSFIPQDNDFIVITKLDSNTTGRPLEIYNKDTESYSIIACDINIIQLDFYGDFAEKNAKIMRTVVNSRMANQFLEPYNASTGRYFSIVNLSDILDNENYIKRFSFKFELFSNSAITDTPLATQLFDNELEYAPNV